MKAILLLCAILSTGCAAIDCQNRLAHTGDGRCFTERICKNGERHLVKDSIHPCEVAK